jgi:hypothetical protein
VLTASPNLAGLSPAPRLVSCSLLAFVALFLLPASRLELLSAWLGFSFAFLLDGFGFVCLGVAWCCLVLLGGALLLLLTYYKYKPP